VALLYQICERIPEDGEVRQKEVEEAVTHIPRPDQGSSPRLPPR
jgi:hypothetical protein